MTSRTLVTIMGWMFLAVSGLVQPALAQEVERAPERPGWPPLVIAAGMALLLAGISFMSSRRSHRD